jgi:hypothetical protein
MVNLVTYAARVPSKELIFVIKYMHISQIVLLTRQSTYIHTYIHTHTFILS